MQTVELILVILILLEIKHFLADFVFQSDYQIQHKGTYGHWGGIQHSLYHSVGTAAIFALFTPWFLILGLLDFLIHYHIDWAKMNINQWRSVTIKDREFWIWLGADQLAHQFTYIGLVGFFLMFLVN